MSYLPTFLNESYSGWVFVLPLLGILLLWGAKVYRKRLQMVWQPREKNPTMQKWRRRDYGKRACLFFGCVFGVLALLGPAWDFDLVPRPVSGDEVAVVLDVSRSMLATDVKPSRMQLAKRLIRDFVLESPGHRLSLVGFAGKAFVQCPLTSDQEIFLAFLDALDPKDISFQGTNFSDALNVALGTIEKGSAGGSGRRKRVVIVSDGEHHDQNLPEILKKLKGAEVSVFAVAVGTPEGGPVPEEGGGFHKNATGRLVISRLKTQTLEEVAKETGGAFAVATTVNVSLREMVLRSSSGLGGAALSQDQVRQEKVWKVRYQGFLLVALVLLGVRWV